MLLTEKSTEIREKCFEMMQSLRKIITELVKSKIDAGESVGIMLKLVAQFYCVVSSFAEHLIDVNKHVTELVNIHG